MRTAKCMTVLLIAVLAGAVTTTARAEQGSVVPPAKEPSNTRTVDCLVRITADPGIISLDISTVEGLLHSSAVLGKAVRDMDILGPDAPQDPHALISIQWLPGNQRRADMGAPKPFPDEQGYSQEMMRQLREMYGEGYADMMVQKTPRGKSDSGDSSAAAGRSTPNEQGRQNGSGSDGAYGGVAGGYGMGRMMGGFGGVSGGMGIGGMGMGGYGGMGGGMGMGGYGGMGGGMGMGGMGMGGIGMGAPYGAPAKPEAGPIAEQSITIRLSVRLPETSKPVAGEFLDALLENLRRSLAEAHRRYAENLDGLLFSTKAQRDNLQERLRGDAADLSPDGARVRKDLDTVVDLSALSPQTPLGEALDLLRNSVDPPLQIVALWGNLREVALVEPSTPIQIDGMSAVRLGTALDVVLKGLSPLPTNPRVVYRIRDNVVVVATPDALQVPQDVSAGQQSQINIQALAAQRNELARTAQRLELELAGVDARRQAIEKEIQNTQSMAQEKLAKDRVTDQLNILVQINTEALETLRKQVESGRLPAGELAKAEESLTRAKIELARRQEELSQQHGTGQLEQYNNELSQIAIDKAEKQAQLEMLRNQRDEVQRQLAQASIFDPEAAQIRTVQETLAIINRRVADLETHLATLRPPTVVVIGNN